MKLLINIIILLVISFGCGHDFSGENLRLVSDNNMITSKILNEERELLISLPSEYDTVKTNYTVLYVMDGREHFNYVRTIINFLSSLDNLPKMIIVGVPHEDRFLDLSYSKDVFFEHECNGPQFTDFIRTELIPHIDSSYRTNGQRILFGHSLGAMYTLNVLFRDSTLFNYYYAASPCFERDTTLLPFIKKQLMDNKKVKPILFVTKEKSYSEIDSISYADFKTYLYSKDSILKFKEVYFEDESHISMAPLSLMEGLKYYKEQETN